MSHKRARERNRRLHKLYANTKYRYGKGAYFSDKRQRIKKYRGKDPDIKTIRQRAARRRLKRMEYSGQKGIHRRICDS